MAPRLSGRGARGAAAAAILLAAAAAFAGATRVRFAAWTTVDEAAHVPAARALRYGGPIANLEHPALVKVLAASVLLPEPAPRAVDEVRRARAPFPLVLAALVLVAGAWVARRAGPAWGAAVAALLAIEPTLRGHGALVDDDVLLALCLVAAAAALDAGARAARRGTLLLAGIFAGLALVSKFSALPMLAVLAGAGILAARAVPRRVAAWRVAAFVVVPALLTAFAVQELAYERVPREALRAGAVAQFRQIVSPVDAGRVVDALPKGTAAWWLGLAWVRTRARPGRWCNVFFDRVSGYGSPFYFPVALALKSTTATVLFVLAALLGSLGALARRRRRLRAALARALLPGLLAFAFLAFAALSNVNIGVRHVLPVVPLGLAACAALASAALAGRARLRAAALFAVVLGAALEAGLLLGHEISFGNLVAGGPHGLRRYLSDSNVDWGQEQGLLFAAARSGAFGRVGAVSILLDEDEAKRAGVKWVARPRDAEGLDTVFVSAFCEDLARRLATCREGWPRLVVTRAWLVPLVGGLERRARSASLAGDTWVVLSMAPTGKRNAPAFAGAP